MKSYILLATSLALASCAGEHQTLVRAMNATAAAVNASSELVVETCDAREGSAVDAATDLGDGRRRLEVVRAECDKIFAALDTLRVTHEAARVAVDAGDAGAGEILLRLASQWRDVQNLIVEWRRLR